MPALRLLRSLLSRYSINHRDVVLTIPGHGASPTCRRSLLGLRISAGLSSADLTTGYVRCLKPNYGYVHGWNFWMVRTQSSAVDPLSERPNTASSGTAPGDTIKDSFQNAEQSENSSVSSYWGVTAKNMVREDGTSWPWHCFKPGDTYSSNTKIDLRKHHVPDTFIDRFALWTVKALRWPTDLFFQKRYGCRAMMLETVAAVPGMVGGMLLHLRSLRRFEHSGGWIKALLDEAENERMHLMTFMEVAKPRWYERALVFTVQGIFFNAYFLLYIISPRLAHRITGYLEEEAIYSYTQYLKEIDNGHLPNVPAPSIAIDYWRLPKSATIKDVVIVVRADEAHHRDVNHFAADLHERGKNLKDSPAPVEYH